MTSLFDGLIMNPAEAAFSPDATSPASGETPSEFTAELDAPPESDEPQCEVCGKDVPRTPTGRKPKHPRCQDHKTRTGETAGTVARSAGKVPQNRLDAIAGDLQTGLGELCGTIAPFAPVTAAVTAMQGPDAAVALVRIAAPYPKFLDGLEKAAKAVPFAEVAKFAAALIFAAAVDAQRIEPVGFAADMLGVSAAAAEVDWQPPEVRAEEAQRQAAQHDWTVPQPPKFKLVK